MVNPREIIGTAFASVGWLVGTSHIGTEVEQIGAVVVLFAGIATAYFGSRNKMNLANALASAETWQRLAEGRDATIHDLQADKDAMRRRMDRADAELASTRERIAALEALPKFDDIKSLVEAHHQENLRNFQAVIGKLG